MSLQSIFNDINSNYNTVKALSNAIHTPYKTDIDQYWKWAKIFSDRAKYYVMNDWQYFNSNIWQYTREILYLIKEFIDEMFLTAGSVESSIQIIFNSYMANVVSDVQNAVQLVQTEMYNEVDSLADNVNSTILNVQNEMYQEINFFADNVDSVILDMQEYLNAEVNAMHNEIDMLSIDVITWIDVAVANFADTLMGRIEAVNTNLTARVDFLETWTQVMIQAIYDYVDIKNAEMLVYINEANSTLYFYINNRVKELDNQITSVQNSLHSRITEEVNALNTDMQELEISVTDIINDLITTTGWNFTFFDLFTFRPELSLLRVLLRPDAEFKRYKPYWQALFAKVLEED